MGCIWICIGSGRIWVLGLSRKEDLDGPLFLHAKIAGNSGETC
jgi:hypothetical protein